jgi:RNA polymerase II-associated protein 3
MDSIRFKEAEDDCTEALDLDDRYIKAYSRRITARKELGKLKEAMDGIQSSRPSFSCFNLSFVVYIDQDCVLLSVQMLNSPSVLIRTILS